MTEFSDAGSGYPYPPGAYPPPYSGPVPPAASPRNGLGVASLIVGIVAVVTSWTVVGGLALGVVAAIIGLVARGRFKRGEATGGGAALIGTLLGIAAAGLSGVLLAILIVGYATGELNEDYQHCLGEHNGMAQYCSQYR
jgi:hypothetical protein